MWGGWGGREPPPTKKRTFPKKRMGMDVHGYPWMSMDVHGYPSMNINGYPSMNIIDGYPSMNIMKNLNHEKPFKKTMET